MNNDILFGMKIAQIVSSFLLIVLVLLQNREEGLGSLFGTASGGEVYRTRRGLEKALYWGTIVLGGLFALISLLIVKYTK